MPEHPEPQPEPKTARGEGCASTSADRKLGKSATGRSRAIARPVTVACSCVRAGRIGSVTDAPLYCDLGVCFLRGNDERRRATTPNGSEKLGRAWRWAQAIHDASPRWDGVRYVSRQMNKGVAYAIFDRSALLKLSAVRLAGRQVDALCNRFNVAAV